MAQSVAAARMYILGGIFGLVQTVIAFFVNPIIGGVGLLLSGFMFLGAIFANRGTIGYYRDDYNPARSGEFPSALCGIFLGPLTIVAVMITFLVSIPGGTFPNLLYIIPAIIAAVCTTFAGGLIMKEMME